MKNLAGIFILAMILGACGGEQSENNNPQEVFFDRIATLCGEQFSGA